MYKWLINIEQVQSIIISTNLILSSINCFYNKKKINAYRITNTPERNENFEICQDQFQIKIRQIIP